MSTQTEAKGRIEHMLTQAKAIIDTADREGRDVTPDEMSTLNDLAAKAQEARDASQRAAKSRNVLAQIEEAVSEDAAKAINDEALDGARSGRSKTAQSPSERFLKSEEFAEMMDRYAPEGEITANAKGVHSRAINLGGLKALITVGDRDNSAGALVVPDNLGLQPHQFAQLVLRDVITTGTTKSDTIEYVQQQRIGEGSVNAAAGVPEATATTGTSGTKPESTLRFIKKTATVETIAHWLPITRKALSDAGQIRTIIDQFLSRGIDERIEEYILSGDAATDGQWDGLLNTSGLQQQEFDRNIIRSVRKAITKIRKYGQSTGVLVSPTTDERLDLLQDETGRFFGNGPWSQGPATIWSLPRVVVKDLPDDKIIVGDLRTAVLWDREQTTISVSDSHNDFFIRNLLAILGEARAGFGVLDPALLAVVDVAGEDDLSPVKPTED